MSYPPRKCEKCRAIGLSHGVRPVIFLLSVPVQIRGIAPLETKEQLEIHWQIEAMICRHCKWSVMDEESLRAMQKAVTKITRIVQVTIQ